MKVLLNEKETEKLYGIPVRTLQKWRLTGEGPTFVKIGRSVRYRECDVERFIDERLRNSTSDYEA